MSYYMVLGFSCGALAMASVWLLAEAFRVQKRIRSISKEDKS